MQQHHDDLGRIIVSGYGTNMGLIQTLFLDN